MQKSSQFLQIKAVWDPKMVLLALTQAMETVPWAMYRGRQRWPDLTVSTPCCWDTLSTDTAGLALVMETAQLADLLTPWSLTGPPNCRDGFLASPEDPSMSWALNKVSSSGLCASATLAYRPTVLCTYTNQQKCGLKLQHLSTASLPWAVGSCAQKFPTRLQAAPHDGRSTSFFFKLSRFLQNYPSFLWKKCKQMTSLLLYICVILSWWYNVTEPAQQLTGLFPGLFQVTNWQTAMHSFLMPLVFSWVLKLSRHMEGSAGSQSWWGLSWHGNWSQQQNQEERTGPSSPFGTSSNQIGSTCVSSP